MAVAWGDWDNDGDPDLAAGNRYGYDRVYRNNRSTRGLLPNSAAHAAIYRPGATDTAYFFSLAEVLTQAKIPIWYRLYDPESDPVARIAAFYSSSCGSDQASAEVTATLFLQAGFEDNAPVCIGEAVVFTNTTVGVPPITYEWDLGDGTTSNQPNPSHTYAAAGQYAVVLSATNPFATDHAGDTVQVGEAPTAGFTYTAAGLTVTFINTSTMASSSLWDFGDGYTSPQENPVHTYTAAGTYTVTLQAGGPCGSDEASAVVTVSGSAPYRVYLPVVIRGYGGGMRR